MPGTAAVITYDARRFDEKIAGEPKYAHDGSRGGSTWRSDVWDYVASR
jgi:hypothetical protein